MTEPKLNSEWQVVGTQYEFKLIDIWGTGTANKYRRTLYELQYKHKSKPQLVTVKKFDQLIETGKIKILNN